MSRHADGRVGRILGLNAAVVYVFLYAPIALLIVFSFNDNSNVSIWTEPSLRWYGEMFQNRAVMGALRNSLIVAFSATLVSTVVGTMLAISLERYRYRGRGFLDGLAYLPIIIPDVTMAVMLLVFFFQAFGVLESLTGISLTTGIHTIILAHIAFNISFVAVVVRARIAQFDKALEEAAADLYATRWQAFWKVTFPLILPGVAGGALLALTLSLDDVVVTQFVSGAGSTTLPVYVFGLVRRGVTPLINAVSVVMLAASMILIAISLGLQRGKSGRTEEEIAEPTSVFDKVT
ncbi:MAG TPA: ABC transporter permease [Acidimicrobiia bacterium]|nr:ABC transporter permease [Acidimicrobiia bacterium]